MSLSQTHDGSDINERLRCLYPAVVDNSISIPKKWNVKDKHDFIGLSQENLKVIYKGQGKTHRDAASVRATHPIPAACGLYYFEIKVISKGRDGYMGVGLSASGVNLNRLPGWDKNSYGYHGDDGHSFCATGTGQSYGPTFTTGDVLGCCLNLVDNSCFYTKNGLHVGVAFRNLPKIPLFPTVGLQTPNEELCANFGQQPFLFDFEDYLDEWRNSNKLIIDKFVVKEQYGNLQSIIHKLVSGYLIHHGYVGTAEAFNNSTKQGLDHYEEITSIKNRQKIQRLVLDGKIGEAIETTDQFFPGLLAKDTNLLFLLKVRQFIEIINGTEIEVKNLTNLSTTSNYNSPVTSPKHPQWNKSTSNSPVSSHNGFSPQRMYQGRPTEQSPSALLPSGDSSLITDTGVKDYSKKSLSDGSSSSSDCDMDTDSDDTGNVKPDPSNGLVSNGLSECEISNGCDNLLNNDYPSSTKQLCGGNSVAIERMLQFGQQLLQMSLEIKPEETQLKNKKLLNNAFSLLAYKDPWSSVVGFQLDRVQREPICTALNSKILESQNLPKKPPLITMISQARLCLQKMLTSDVGTAAFVSMSDYL